MIAVKCEQGKLLSCTEFYCMFQNMYEEEKVLYCLKVNRFYSDKIVKSNKATVVVERRKFGAVGTRIIMRVIYIVTLYHLYNNLPIYCGS